MGMESDNDVWFDYLNFHPGYPCSCMPNMEVCYRLPEDDMRYSRNVKIKTQISIQPNPAGDFASIQYLLPGIRTNQSYGLYNIRGQKIASGVLNGDQGNLHLDLSKYPSGSYLIKIGSEYGKFMKVK